jgi:ribose 5-phosphate isomerase A
MTQEELKQLVGHAAADYVRTHALAGSLIGVGTGSTVNCFIDALALDKERYRGAVSSSQASTRRLQQHGIPVFDLNDIDTLSFYIDGADEINATGQMIKGGGGALTCEKILAAVAREFICIADTSKQVEHLGRFPLPIEIIPMAQAAISRHIKALGGNPMLRRHEDGTLYTTDHGNPILDVSGLLISSAEATALETQINNWPGVVTVGLFTQRGADMCLLGAEDGVRQVSYAG